MDGRVGRHTVALGIAGGLVGIYVYAMMSPSKQHKIEKTMKKTSRELKDAAGELGKAMKTMG